MVRGSCLCGSVRYEVHGKFPRIVHCHCRMCRKAHGAAFGSYGEIRAESFKLVSGEVDIASYESSPGVRRTFCRKCGATLRLGLKRTTLQNKMRKLNINRTEYCS